MDALVIKDLKKSYKSLKVLDGISFTVPKGSIFALLGPNGAGKTTTIRILSTLLRPDSGQVLVNGFDVKKDSDKVRSSIGLTGQYAAVDEYLTAQENMVMMGQLYRLEKDVIQVRTQELLKRFELENVDRIVKTYSGGMRRRLDLAMSLIASPPIIFLDEPTTGLDPRSRLTMWEVIKDLAAKGVTILLTTQHMDEADQLAHNIIVIDNGKVIAQGTPDQLKRLVGSEYLEFTIAKASDFEKAKKAIDGKTLQSDKQKRTISVTTSTGVSKLKLVLARLEKAKVGVENVQLRRPTLDDVFLKLTGHTATKEEKK